MNRVPAVACAATILLAHITGAAADTASSTSLAPVGEPAAIEAAPLVEPRLAIEPAEGDLAARPFADIIAQEARRAGVPVELAHAIVKVESNYRVHVTGRAGEIGLMQIKPATARDMGFEGNASELYNPLVNIKYGMKYLAGAAKRGGGTLCGTILKYNAGHYSKRMNPTSARYCEKVKVVLASL